MEMLKVRVIFRLDLEYESVGEDTCRVFSVTLIIVKKFEGTHSS